MSEPVVEVVKGAAAAVGLVLALAKGGSSVREWIDSAPAAREVERRKAELELARDLDALGEHTWASEHREYGNQQLAKRLARYEMNRKWKKRTIIIAVGWVSYIAAVVLVLVAWWLPLAIGRVLVGVGGAFLMVAGAATMIAAVTKWWFERDVSECAKKKRLWAMAPEPFDRAEQGGAPNR